MAEVQVNGLTLDYGTSRALDGVSLVFPNGQLFGLLGPSGSGKTTLLRCIAGFVFPDAGTVMIGGEPVERVPVEKREIGMMFQSYALFPNMSVADNIGFGLKVRRVEAGDLKRRVSEALDLVQLAGLGGRKPHELSGGQRQRVALARAIVTRPRVLLLDEPLSALDKALRVEMQVELKRIQREVGITTIFVTHDQEEALTLSDQIGILRNGRLVQSGPPRELYHCPLDRFTASFLGDANFFSGTPEGPGLRLADGTLLPWPRGAAEPGTPVIAVRPEEMTVSARQQTADPGRCLIHGELRNVIFSGPTAVCVVAHGDQLCKILVKNSELGGIPAAGPVSVSWPAERSMLINQ
ncbi:ABC transporter ATP-binding protein [Aestuariivirga sp.]|uniref:ABC transporter ATP-binding protein n=1 Tax=Aestuariivirga sp. TaxID=2650926 RepID=UPI0035940480